MNKTYIYIAQALQIGFDIFGILILGVILGVYLDSKLDCAPIGVLSGAFLGIISCFKALLKLGRK